MPRIADALKRHDADIVVLSEYRGGPSAPRLVTALHALGYRHATTLVPPPSRNGVLVAAWRPLREHGAVDVGLPEPYRMVNVDLAMTETVHRFLRPARYGGMSSRFVAAPFCELGPAGTDQAIGVFGRHLDDTIFSDGDAST